MATPSNNPLNIAAKVGQLHCVQEIIRTKPELAKEPSQDGFQTLDIASTYGYFEIAGELLASSGPRISSLPGRDGRTSMNGRVEDINELFKARADSVKYMIAFGETALQLVDKYFKKRLS